MSLSPKNIQKLPNKLLHRFYEPLILLFILDQCQGDHVRRQRDLPSAPYDASRADLRRRFLESLAYACDFEKGGDTVTAVAVSVGPLTYHLAMNKSSVGRGKIVEFLSELLKQLRSIDFSQVTGDLVQRERKVLEYCINFGEDRISTYQKSLQKSLNICQRSSIDPNVQQELALVHEKVSKYAEAPADLCTYCYGLITGNGIDHIRVQATRENHDGSSLNPFAELRHYIGRLAQHIQIVKVMLIGARRFPGLLEECDFNLVPSPPSLQLPSTRNKLNLNSIADRMVGNDKDQLQEIQIRLSQLDPLLNLEACVRAEYEEKNIKPRVHAELILLEYFYQHREVLRFYENDKYIGVSKPACYCCNLYIREHPGGFVQPSTHQKIYLNWLPPVSASNTWGLEPEQQKHGQRMLNRMVQKIRQEVISQIMLRTGEESRRHQHDSITWSSLPHLQGSIRSDDRSPARLPIIEESSSSIGSPSTPGTELSIFVAWRVRPDAEDSDSDGGVHIGTSAGEAR